ACFLRVNWDVLENRLMALGFLPASETSQSVVSENNKSEVSETSQSKVSENVVSEVSETAENEVSLNSSSSTTNSTRISTTTSTSSSTAPVLADTPVETSTPPMNDGDDILEG